MSANATVHVGGRPLGTLGQVSGLEWSHRWRYDEISGPHLASWSWSVQDFAAGWFHEGADVRIVDQGVLRWGGRLTEPEVTDAGIDCNAVGYGTLAADFDALVDEDPTSAVAYTPTSAPDVAVDAAILRGLPWARTADLGIADLGLTDGITETVETIVLRGAKLAGKRALVDEFGRVSYVADPTSPRLLLPSMSDYLGTADEQFLTRMFGYYVSSVDGVTGEPNAWATVWTEDAAAAAKFGQQRELTVDLTPLGLLTAGVAEDHIEGRFALVGGRMGWTRGFVAGSGTRLMTGEGVDPAAMRAGDMVAIPGVRDSRSQKTTLAMVEIILGETRHVVDEGLTYCTPLGHVPRDFSSAIAAAQAPKEVEVA